MICRVLFQLYSLTGRVAPISHPDWEIDDYMRADTSENMRYALSRFSAEQVSSVFEGDYGF